MQIHKPERAIGIHFKHEDTDPVCGPVWFQTDTAELIPAFIREHEDSEPTTGWMTLAETLKMGKHFGLPVTES